MATHLYYSPTPPPPPQKKKRRLKEGSLNFNLTYAMHPQLKEHVLDEGCSFLKVSAFVKVGPFVSKS